MIKNTELRHFHY